MPTTKKKFAVLLASAEEEFFDVFASAKNFLPFTLQIFPFPAQKDAMPCNIVFLDENCHGSPGKLIDKFKKDLKADLIIWMTTDMESERTTLALGAGVFDCLSLPPKLPEVLLRIKRSIEFLALAQPDRTISYRCLNPMDGNNLRIYPSNENKKISSSPDSNPGNKTDQRQRPNEFHFPSDSSPGATVKIKGSCIQRKNSKTEKLKTLGQLAAGIAHEISNPLTAISSYAQLMALNLKDKKSIESASRIQKGIERIHHILNNLAGFMEPNSQSFFPTDLNNVLEDTLSFCEYEIKRDEIEIIKSIQTPLPKVLASKDQLNQLLLNLLTNARDALGGRGVIEITTKSEGKCIFLEVRDNGVGLNADEMEKIFEPFYTTKPIGQGSGLGLFVAMGIAKNHGGELAAIGNPGRGTTFTLRLPAFSP